MLNNINIILSKLDPSEYREYWRAWKGKHPDYLDINESDFDSWLDYNEDKQPLSYVEAFDKKLKEILNQNNPKEIQELKNIVRNEVIEQYNYNNYDEKLSDQEIIENYEKENGKIDDFDVDDLYDILKNLYYNDENEIFSRTDYLEYSDNVMESLRNEFEREIYKNIFKYHKNKKYDISQLYKKLFNGKFRIVLPIERMNDIDLKNIYYNTIFKKIDYFYKAIDIYFDNYNTKQNKDDWFYKNIKDLMDGYIVNKNNPNKKISIGKILSVVIKNKKNLDINLNGIKTFNTIYNQRMMDYKNDLFIVISRHPYDIAGMSTDRGWSSCMNINDGQYKEYVMGSIVNGALIAYTVNKNDLNIENPINRFLIKPYIKENEELNFEKPNFILKVSEVYGNRVYKVLETVQNWLDKNWNSKIEEGTYKLDSDIIYNEDVRTIKHLNL